MDPAVRHRTLALLGIVEVRSEFRKVPRDGDGDGFFDPDGKGPAPDRTPVPPRRPRVETWKRPDKLPGVGQIQPHTPPAPSAPDPQTMADQVKHWHRQADLPDIADLLESAASGGKATHLVDHGPDVRAAAVEFGDGGEGVSTRYLGDASHDAEDQADSDQIVSALARAFGISAPRVLRIDDDRTVSDLVDGPTWAESDQDLDTPAAQRLGLLDLLAGIDTRDEGTVRLGPDGVVPVQSAGGFTDVAAGTGGRDDKRSERLKRIAAAIDASGPRGLSRADITAQTGGNITPAQRDELLAELLDSGDYVQLPNSRGNKGQGSRFVGLRRHRPSASTSGRDPAQAPHDDGGLAFWTAFAADGEWVGSPLTDEDARWLRQQLDEMRPQFAHLGRPHWWQFASDRLDILAAHASGAENLFAPHPLTELSTSELAALLRAHGLPSTGGRETLLRRLYAAGITA